MIGKKTDDIRWTTNQIYNHIKHRKPIHRWWLFLISKVIIKLRNFLRHWWSICQVRLIGFPETTRPWDICHIQHSSTTKILQHVLPVMTCSCMLSLIGGNRSLGLWLNGCKPSCLFLVCCRFSASCLPTRGRQPLLHTSMTMMLCLRTSSQPNMH